MKLSTQPYKGTRDFYPEDMRVRTWMFNTLRKVCESFGYEEYDTPILEPIELYTAKTSEEIVNEQTYSFDDRGGRRVVMRPEMTPSVSRMVAGKRQELGYPLRMYSIPNCFRYERPQRGRLREFWQLNADIFGMEGVEADIEVILLADACMKAFGARPGKYEIRVNSRVLTEKLLEGKGFSKTLAPKIINLLDKIGKPDFIKHLSNFEPFVQDRIKEFVDEMKDTQFITTVAEDSDLANVLSALTDLGVDVKPDLSISRGFDYYTDIVFEVFDTNPENNRSMFGGGRYDGLVGAFGVEPVPTVGFGMGDVTLLNFLQSNNLVPELSPATDAIAVLVGDISLRAQEVVSELRAAGLNIAVDSTDRKLDKKLKAADKLGVKNVIFIGEQELADGLFGLKNLQTGDDQRLSVVEIARALLDYRR